MAYFLLIFDPSFGFESVKVIQATRYSVDEEGYSFTREDRVVYRVPIQYLRSCEAHETHRAAMEAATSSRVRYAGKGRIHVDESSLPSAEGTRAPAAFTERVGVVFSGDPKS